jgi:2-polyprenyl-3-methyl-5-hydroxy-6-metoxy-1,4-benzoquinol methylase
LSSSQNGYDPNFFEHLFKSEDKHFWFQSRNRIIASLVRQMTAVWSPGYQVLEVGCGNGNVLRVLEHVCTNSLVIGMDLFAEGLRQARHRVACPLVQGDMHSPPFRSNFRIIGLYDVLEHLPDDHQVLSDLYQMLSPDGLLMLTVPAHMALWSYFDEASHHYRRYSRNDLTEKLQNAGYCIEYISYYMLTLYPIVWLNRRVSGSLKNHTQQSEYELALQELRVSPLLNSPLNFILRWEQAAISARYTLPFGTSLIVIARKQ